MINEIYPFAYHRYLALPVLGSIIDDFDNWLVEQGYRRYSRILYVNDARRIDTYFNSELGRKSVTELTLDDFHRCWVSFHSHKLRYTRTVLNVKMFLQWKSLLPSDPQVVHQFSMLLDPYKVFLTEVRGLAANTIHEHLVTVAQFLEYLECKHKALQLKDLAASDVEDFVCHIGKKLKRQTLQHSVAHLRCFLRFLAQTTHAPSGLNIQIDSPRVYRQEQLPCALPWETVCAFLDSIDQKKPIGIRDYTIFFLMATYGLRCCDIRALTLENIDWSQGEIHINQSKTGKSLFLPLTDAVGSVLLHYLRNGRPHSTYRQLFLRTRAPNGPLRHKAVTQCFHAWVKRSGLDIAGRGAHCLRHSYAVHLLKLGQSVKVIGDLLGHMTIESTGVYLRLDLKDLREVALSLPQDCFEQQAQEVSP